MSKENPFLKKGTSSVKAMDYLFNKNPTVRTPAPPTPTPTLPNPHQQENKIENAPLVNQSLATFQDISKKAEIQRPKQVTPIKIPTSSTEHVKLSLKINSKMTKMDYISEGKTMKSAFSSLTKLNFDEQILQKANIQRKLKHDVSASLKLLDELIRGSCGYINNAILTCRNNNPMNVRYRIGQIRRIFQGLCYYLPVRNSAISFLQMALLSHPFFHLITSVSKYYSLDVLKSFYVVREIHQSAKKISKNYSLVDKEHPSSLFSENETVKFAEKFLEKDKCHLLACYGQYLSRARPSDQLLCRVGQQIAILWTIIYPLANQPLQIQRMGCELFLRYWNLCPNRMHISGDHLSIMRDRLLNMKLQGQLITKLYEIGINDILKSGFIKSDAFKGPFKDIYHVVIGNQDIDFVAALSLLKQIDKLASEWLPYLNKFLLSLQFSGSSKQKLMKAIYICNIIKLTSDNSKYSISDAGQHNLIKLLSKVSIMLGLISFEFVNILNLKIWFLRSCLQHREQDLTAEEDRDRADLSTYLSGYKEKRVGLLLLQTAYNTFQAQLNRDDLSTLEKELSMGRVITLDFNLEQPNYHCIRYFVTLFWKMPSYQLQIQETIAKLFYKLRQDKYPFQKSLMIYNQSLLQKTVSMQIIKNHLEFILNIIVSSDIEQMMIVWLRKIVEEFIVGFQDFIKIFLLVGEAYLQKDEIMYLSIISEFSSVLKESIYDFYQNLTKMETFPSKSISLFIIFKQIIEHNIISQRINDNIIEIFNFIKQELINQDFSSILMKEPFKNIKPTEKIVVYCELMKEKVDYKYSLKQNRGNFTTINQKILDIYPEFCGQITNCELEHAIIDPFEAASQYDPLLFEMMLNSNSQKLISVVQQKATFKKIHYSKLLTIAMELRNATNLSNLQNSLANISILKAVQWMKDVRVSLRFYEMMMELLIKTANRLQFQLHWNIVRYIINQNGLEKINNLSSDQLAQYGLYLLCLYIVKHKQTLTPNNPQENRQIIKDMQVFVRYGMEIISKHSSSAHKFSHSDSLIQYLQKLCTFLSYCNQFSILQRSTFEHFEQLKQRLQQSDNTRPGLFKEIITFIMQRTNSLNFILNDETKSMQIKQCANEVEFNQLFLHHINLFPFMLAQQKSDFYFLKMVDFLTKNKHFKLETFIKDEFLLTESSLIKPQTILLYLSFIKRYILHLHSTQLCHLIEPKGKRIIRKIIQNLKKCLEYSQKGLSKILVLKFSINIIQMLIKRCIISPFVVFQSFGEQFKMLLSRLNEPLEEWDHFEQTDTLQQTLSTNYLKIQARPKGKSRNLEEFSLWNFIQYRQKLLFMRDLFECCRQFNGLLSFQSFNLQKQFSTVLNFLVNNFNLLKNEQNTRQLQDLNRFLSMNDMKQKSIIKIIDNECSLASICKVCEQIKHVLELMSVDLSPETQKRLQNLTQSMKK